MTVATITDRPNIASYFIAHRPHFYVPESWTARGYTSLEISPGNQSGENFPWFSPKEVKETLFPWGV
jgi:hypothetical protein